MDDRIKKPRRQRAILSCNDCRRRKLSCDRLDPCNRCIKGGIAGSCTYGPGAHETSSQKLPARLTLRKSKRDDRNTTSRVTGDILESDGELNAIVSTGLNLSGTSGNSELRRLDHEMTQLQQVGPGPEQGPKDQVEFLAKSPELKGISRSSAVMGMLKGRNYATQFYGASSPMAVVAHVSKQCMSLICETTASMTVSRAVPSVAD
jgi:hypothetical protein